MRVGILIFRKTLYKVLQSVLNLHSKIYTGVMLKYLFITLTAFTLSFAQYDYSYQDMNTTSPSHGENVWNPVYTDHITLHYFSSQG